MKTFVGTGVALVTPFNENKMIDEESLRKLVNHVIDGGVNFLVVLGTTAEIATLSIKEREEVARIICEENHERLPMMVGVGGNNTMAVAEEMKELSWLKKFQGILSITPYYNKPNQEGLYQHFKYLSQVAPLPLCLYNVPGRTGVNISVQTVERLSRECPNIMALKEASGDLEQAAAFLRTKRSDFTLLSGDDFKTLSLMSLGFEGVISVIANVVPELCVRMVNCIREGNYQEAQQIHLKLSTLCLDLFEEGNPSGVKAALFSEEIISHNVLRLPLTPVSDALFTRIKNCLVQIKKS